jgi:integrase/recombinase XerD
MPKTLNGSAIGKCLSVHTINIRIRGLSAFFRFLSTEGIIPDSPTENISQVRDDEHEEVPGIPDEQIDAIFAAYDDRQFAQWRDKTLILLLLDTGLRIGEALSLTAEQINFKDLTVTVPSRIAKNRKSHEIPISREVAKRLRQLLDETEQNFRKGRSTIYERIWCRLYRRCFSPQIKSIKAKIKYS